MYIWGSLFLSFLLIGMLLLRYSVAFFPPLPTAVAVFFLFKKKKSQKRNILYSMHWYCKSNQSRFLLFLSLWLVNSEKEVQFECSDDGEDLYRQIFFPPVKRSHLEIKQLHLALLTYCENCKTWKYNLVNFKPAVAICLPQRIVQPFFQASLYFFLTWGHTKAKK